MYIQDTEPSLYKLLENKDYNSLETSTKPCSFSELKRYVVLRFTEYPLKWGFLGEYV